MCDDDDHTKTVYGMPYNHLWYTIAESQKDREKERETENTVSMKCLRIAKGQ